MNETIKNLTDIAYTLYPKGVEDSSQEYTKTTENHKLRKLLENKSILTKKIDFLGKALTSENKIYNFENLTNLLIYDRCLKAKFFHNDFKVLPLLLYVSLVEPYYLLYQQSNNLVFRNIKDLTNSSVYIDEPATENLKLKNKIEEFFPFTFPNYKIFPKEYLDVKVENIIFDGIGCLDSFHKSENIFPMTFFNVFFSNVYF